MKSPLQKICLAHAMLLIVACLSGCATPEQQAAQQAVVSYSAGDYSGAKKLLQPISKNTNEDFVLNNVRLGSTDLAIYDLTDAEAAFLRAYEVINSLGVNDGGRSLGAVLVDEKIKIWKGEPFERAMTNFYLGLVFYMEQDYNNARGAFENAMFKLRDYTTDDELKSNATDKYREVESNFILAQYMLARCYQRLGEDDLARANYKRMVDLRPHMAGLADFEMNAQSNVLVVIDFGTGPHKETNMDGALVGFAPHPQQVGPVPMPYVGVDGSWANISDKAHPLVDLLALAQDRRWESIDTIRAIKSVAGSGLMGAGAYELARGESNTSTEVGLGLLAAGLLLKATSQADVRVWEFLPRSTFIIPLTVPPGTHNMTVEFPGIRQTWENVNIPANSETTLYFRMQRPGTEHYTWPPPTLTGWPSRPPTIADVR
jgi:tetratricopeptide (TPR) repeat protein